GMEALERNLQVTERDLIAVIDFRGQNLLNIPEDQIQPDKLLALERLYKLFELRRITYQKSLEETARYEVLSSPFLLPFNSRFQKLRLLVTGIGLGTLFSFFLALFLIAGRSRIISSAQLGSISDALVLAETNPTALSPEALRQLYGSLLLGLPPDAKTWSFAGSQTLPVQSDTVDALANDLRASGYSTCVIRIRPGNSENNGAQNNPSENVTTESRQHSQSQTLNLPATELARWLTSRYATERLQSATEQYDRVLLDLPALRDFPENRHLIDQAQAFVRFVQARTDDRRPLVQFQSEFDENLSHFFVWVQKSNK
ncbi:MAG: hypothetical protein AAF570_12765, partial [Bacteroidota bacterium]